MAGPGSADILGPMDHCLRRATSADQAILRRAVHQAWRWRHPWDEAAFVEHTRRGEPDSYVDGFSTRSGDAGLLAAARVGEDRIVCGAAWLRMFTPETQREGFVDEDTPEVVIAVFPGWRGHGIGRHLLEELMVVAHDMGVFRLSLHVDTDNSRAIDLYHSAGFRRDGLRGPHGMVMVAPLAPGRRRLG